MRGAPASRSDAETNLRRASRGAGCAALLLFPVVIYGLNGGWPDIQAAVAQPRNSLLLVLYGIALAFCLVYIAAGAAGCWGMRKKDLTVFAIARLAGGGIALFYLWRSWPLHDLLSSSLLLNLRLILLLPAYGISIWFVVTGAVRLLLLTVGGGSAGRVIRKHLKDRTREMRPARPRSY